MIKRSSEVRVETALNIANGQGEVRKEFLYEQEDFCGKGKLFSKIIVKPGDSIGYHKHEGEQEAYYILKGEALYDDNGEEKIVKGGDVTICRSGEGHSLKNIGDDDLEFIALIHYV